MICPKCKTEIKDDSIFCTKCGFRVQDAEYCRFCGQQLSGLDEYCPKCGRNEEGQSRPTISKTAKSVISNVSSHINGDLKPDTKSIMKEKKFTDIFVIVTAIVISVCLFMKWIHITYSSFFDLDGDYSFCKIAGFITDMFKSYDMIDSDTIWIIIIVWVFVACIFVNTILYGVGVYRICSGSKEKYSFILSASIFTVIFVIVMIIAVQLINYEIEYNSYELINNIAGLNPVAYAAGAIALILFIAVKKYVKNQKR